MAQIEQSVPALIVLDLMLPGLSGIDLCRAVRRFCDVCAVVKLACATLRESRSQRITR